MKGESWKQSPGVREARRLIVARKGPATEADAPIRSGRGPRPLPGQIDIYGSTHGFDIDVDEEEETAA